MRDKLSEFTNDPKKVNKNKATNAVVKMQNFGGKIVL
jgi:hypothetical protein